MQHWSSKVQVVQHGAGEHTTASSPGSPAKLLHGALHGAKVLLLVLLVLPVLAAWGRRPRQRSKQLRGGGRGWDTVVWIAHTLRSSRQRNLWERCASDTREAQRAKRPAQLPRERRGGCTSDSIDW